LTARLKRAIEQPPESTITGEPNRTRATESIQMRANIHPDYRTVVFRDVSSDFQFVTRSTVKTKDVCEIDGQEYPLIKIDISSASHPFYTGTQKILDTEGRVERFYRKYGFKKLDEHQTDQDKADQVENEQVENEQVENEQVENEQDETAAQD
jgi:large subunit ribosomal protein L31